MPPKHWRSKTFLLALWPLTWSLAVRPWCGEPQSRKAPAKGRLLLAQGGLQRYGSNSLVTLLSHSSITFAFCVGVATNATVLVKRAASSQTVNTCIYGSCAWRNPLRIRLKRQVWVEPSHSFLAPHRAAHTRENRCCGQLQAHPHWLFWRNASGLKQIVARLLMRQGSVATQV